MDDIHGAAGALVHLLDPQGIYVETLQEPLRPSPLTPVATINWQRVYYLDGMGDGLTLFVRDLVDGTPSGGASTPIGPHEDEGGLLWSRLIAAREALLWRHQIAPG